MGSPISCSAAGRARTRRSASAQRPCARPYRFRFSSMVDRLRPLSRRGKGVVGCRGRRSSRGAARAGGRGRGRCRSTASAPRSAVRAPDGRRPAHRSRGDAGVRSCSIDVLCAPTAPAPSMRRSTAIGSGRRAFSPIAWPSSIIARATARVPASPTISASVPPVSAEIGLKERLPQSLTRCRCGCRRGSGAQPEAISASERRTMRSVRSPDGSPSGKRSPSTWRISPGASTSAAGIDDAADHPAPDRCGPRWRRRDRPPASAFRERPALAEEVPPGTPFRAVTTVVSGPTRGTDLVERAGNGMRLQRQDHVILRSELGGVAVARTLCEVSARLRSAAARPAGWPRDEDRARRSTGRRRRRRQASPRRSPPMARRRRCRSASAKAELGGEPDPLQFSRRTLRDFRQDTMRAAP